MEEVNNQTPMENTPVQETPVITDLQSSPPEEKKNILIPLLLLIIALLVGTLAYLFFTDRIDIEDNDSPTKEGIVEDEEETMEEEQIQEEEDEIMTKEYINTDVGVKFEYPKDWIVEASSACKPGECKDLSLTISENSDLEFVFSYALPAGSGPEICYFSNSGMTDEIGMGTVYESFDNIDERGTLRRTYVIDEGPNGPLEQYKVCKLGSEGLYSNWVKPGYISYNVTMEREDAQDIIKLMDKMTLSFEYTGEDY